jgi:hypothetical protein
MGGIYRQLDRKPTTALYESIEAGEATLVGDATLLGEATLVGDATLVGEATLSRCIAAGAGAIFAGLAAVGAWVATTAGVRTAVWLLAFSSITSGVISALWFACTSATLPNPAPRRTPVARATFQPYRFADSVMFGLMFFISTLLSELPSISYSEYGRRR